MELGAVVVAPLGDDDGSDREVDPFGQGAGSADDVDCALSHSVLDLGLDVRRSRRMVVGHAASYLQSLRGSPV